MKSAKSAKSKKSSKPTKAATKPAKSKATVKIAAAKSAAKTPAKTAVKSSAKTVIPAKGDDGRAKSKSAKSALVTSAAPSKDGSKAEKHAAVAVAEAPVAAEATLPEPEAAPVYTIEPIAAVGDIERKPMPALPAAKRSQPRGMRTGFQGSSRNITDMVMRQRIPGLGGKS